MLIMSKNIVNVKATERMLARKFDMKDLGVPDVILRIKFLKTLSGLALSQTHYI